MKKNILIADDSLFIRLNLVGILMDKYKVIEAEDGQSALLKFKKEKPDLVLLDIVMPGAEAEGLRVLEEMIKLDPNAKVIMLTAMRQDFVVEKCMKAGAKAYLVKPADAEHILGAVEKFI